MLGQKQATPNPVMNSTTKKVAIEDTNKIEAVLRDEPSACHPANNHTGGEDGGPNTAGARKRAEMQLDVRGAPERQRSLARANPIAVAAASKPTAPTRILHETPTVSNVPEITVAGRTTAYGGAAAYKTRPRDNVAAPPARENERSRESSRSTMGVTTTLEA